MEQFRDSQSILEPYERILFNFAGYMKAQLAREGACRIQRTTEHDIRSTSLIMVESESEFEAIWLSEELVVLKSKGGETPLNFQTTGIDWLRFRLALKGKFVTEHGPHQCEADAKYCSFLYLPENDVLGEAFTSDNGLSFVDVFCSRRQFVDLVGNDIAGLPLDVCHLLHGSPTQKVEHQIHLTPTMERMVDEILRAPDKVAMKPLFYRFKSLALLYELITGVRSERGTSSFMDDKDSAPIIAAYEVLLSNFVTPPSLDKLAREVGVNRTSLAQGFRELFGLSIGEFCLELRMERGWHLLSRSSLPVNEIAHQLGYEHTANFSTAIKRWFGQTPREIRQAGYR